MNVEIGYMLGDWKNELDTDDQIVSFVALGPKTYSYKTRKGKSALKCKGFTLNSANSAVVTHQALIDRLQTTSASLVRISFWSQGYKTHNLIICIKHQFHWY